MCHVHARFAAALLVAASMISAAMAAPAEPVLSNTGPDAAAYGANLGYPLGKRTTTSQQQFLVGAYSHFDQLFDSRKIARPAVASPLKRAENELSLSYRYQNARYTLEDYLERHPTTGLLIAKDGTILFEHYRYGRSDKDRFLSQSIAKTITAMLIGIAVSEGRIRSIDEPASVYVPELRGSEYGATPIRALLHMASGIEFREDYDGTDDISKMSRELFRADMPGTAAVMAQFNKRVAPPDTRFSYASVETNVLGLVLRKAVGEPVADYARDRLWQKLGAEADASWIIDASGQETTYCCFNAVLRDYARLGLMLAHDGAWNGQQIVPKDWVIAMTTPEAEFLTPRLSPRALGYGYQTWLFPVPWRQFALLGVRGQVIYVDPPSKLVLVHTAVRLKPSKDPAAAELSALWRALVEAHGG
jgi:CubicO group peptidase (beta-lactamase class C family)